MMCSVPDSQVDIRENKDAYIFKMDAPGLRKEAIKVRVTPDNLLVISGERVKDELEEDDTGFHRCDATRHLLTFPCKPSSCVSDDPLLFC